VPRAQRRGDRVQPVGHGAGLSQYLWKIEQPAHAVANGYFVGAINRVGTEGPWNIGKFYGTSYFVNPRGETVVQASEDNDELVVADLDLNLIDEVRSTWQFFRDRRPTPTTRSSSRRVPLTVGAGPACRAPQHDLSFPEPLPPSSEGRAAAR
jgi:hypothetical protein